MTRYPFKWAVKYQEYIYSHKKTEIQKLFEVFDFIKKKQTNQEKELLDFITRFLNPDRNITEYLSLLLILRSYDFPTTKYFIYKLLNPKIDQYNFNNFGEIAYHANKLTEFLPFLDEYRKQAINRYKKEEFEKAMDLLYVLIRKCNNNDHLDIATKFSEDLLKLAIENDHSFYRGVAYYSLGYLQLKEGDKVFLEDDLKRFQDAAINFQKERDYLGLGLCYHKIGTIYDSKLKKIDNACLFYREAIENYNKAIIKVHPLRKPIENKLEAIIEKIVKLVKNIEVLVPNIENHYIRKKIIDDLNSIDYNFNKNQYKMIKVPMEILNHKEPSYLTLTESPRSRENAVKTNEVELESGLKNKTFEYIKMLKNANLKNRFMGRFKINLNFKLIFHVINSPCSSKEKRFKTKNITIS